ncbi:MAG: ComEC/Rec2 family competence protein [Intestinibacter sp.]|uniref:ComEC/Rec2 family competence protein n=1 Tax=Intestinibacter sp. TaxID=1965304 RepID=UPI002A7F5FC5|nr:ComEC/Rec2 family competence protein [Intestinibacter sp.]MDY4576082.1 ComEC/Rec2 family competence protein [Intestinibacter sp.]
MRRPLLLIFILLLILGFFITKDRELDNINEDTKTTITGVVKDKKEKSKYTQYIIDGYLVNDYKRKYELKIGKVVSVQGKQKDLDKMEFDDFNYGRYIRSCGYKGVIYSDYFKVIGQNKFYINLGQLKMYMRDTFRYLYKDTSNFINSFLLGMKDDLTQEENEMFSRTGTSHVIAISGLHTNIICILIAYVIRGINKLYKLFILMIIMVLYSIMVGFSPSIVRAVAFVAVMYLAVFLFKKRDGITTLSLIASVLIINNPYTIYNVSFQLSFLATLSILYFNKIIKKRLKFDIVSMTIAANILTMPIVYYVFGGIPVLSILGNIVIIPFIGIIMNLSIFSILFFEFNLNITKVIVYINKTLINMVYYILDKLSQIEIGYIEVENPKMTYVIIYYVLIFSYMIYKELKTMKEQENEIQGYCL